MCSFCYVSACIKIFVGLCKYSLKEWKKQTRCLLFILFLDKNMAGLSFFPYFCTIAQ